MGRCHKKTDDGRVEYITCIPTTCKADPCIKFEVSGISRCGDFTWGVKFYNGSPDPDHAPFGKIFHWQGGTCYCKSMYQI